MVKTKLMMIAENYQYAKHLCRLVDYEALGFEIVGIEYNGALGLEQFSEYKPRVVLLDACIPIIGVDQFIRLMQNYTMDFIVLLLDDSRASEANSIQHIYSVLPKTDLSSSMLNEALQAATRLLARTGKQEYTPHHSALYYMQLTSIVGDGQFTMDRMYTLRNEFNWSLTSTVHLLLLKPIQALMQISCQLLNDLQQQLDTYEGGVLLAMHNGGILLIINTIEGNDRHNSESLYDKLLSELAHIARIRYKLEFHFLLGSACKLSGLTEQYKAVSALFPMAYFMRETPLVRTSVYNALVDGMPPMERLIREVVDGIQEPSPLLLSHTLDSIYITVLKPGRNIEYSDRFRRRLMYLHQVLLYSVGERGVFMPADFSYEAPYIEDELAYMQTTFAALQRKIAEGGITLNSLTLHAAMLIISRFTESISLKSVADLVNITPSYLSHLFKKELGLTFSDLLANLRICEACQIILHSDKKIFEIAAEVGFTDYRYFSSVFRKQTSMRPSEYRTKLFPGHPVCEIVE